MFTRPLRLLSASTSFPLAMRTDLAVLNLIEEERDPGKAHIDLPGHSLCERRSDAAGGGRLGRELVLRNQRKESGVARRTGERIGDGSAVEVLDRLDRGLARHVPIKIRRADDFAADDADRRPLAEGAEGGLYAARGGNVDAAGDQSLVDSGQAWVYSRSSPCFLKMPPRLPSSGRPASQEAAGAPPL